MNGDPSTPYSRDLGDELRQVRERYTTFRGRKIARMLGWDPGKVSNIENGKVRATEIDLVQYLGRCGRSQEFIHDFLDRYRSAFDHYFVQVPDNLRTMAMADSTAHKITTYNITTIPGLVQTEAYARAVFEARGVLTPDLIEAAVRFRMNRQAILLRPDRPACTLYIHENALRVKVGSDEVMKDQFMRLLYRTHVVRIVPAACGPSGVFMANYVLWQYEKRSGVAFTESDIAKVFVQDLAGVKRCKSIFTRLDALALDEEQSRTMVANFASRSREDLSGRRLHLA
ncbi:helix-turn-helix transcriptional regulator [Lentzea sp.]|uniref:helix-turn-helix domain-containing protein n=1 Tax=Lentzea sp. TaxID=56099 RepID=UPI002CC45F92|nr:helix-turn-helix transcriptional regulator [Lentzea sp.]HUQ56850.1 helix-turn-helix transcriptional regulator [Lentzea sp.]